MEKNGIYIMVHYTYCEGNYLVTSTKCITRQKIEKKARKWKIEKVNEKTIKVLGEYNPPMKEPIEDLKEIDIDIDFENLAERLL